MRNIKKLAAIFMLVSFIFGTALPAMAGNGTVINSYNGTISQKTGTDAGDYSTAMGYQTNAIGNYSTAMGYQTNAIDASSTAMGYQTTASGLHSTAMGGNTTAGGESSTAMGIETTASGYASTAMGWLTTASIDASTALGFHTTASGRASVAMGDWTTASGPIALATGTHTCATGAVSVAMGDHATASGTISVAMGKETIASGERSTAMGGNTQAIGIVSTAMGNYTIAEGEASVAMGNHTYALGDGSTAMGTRTTASGQTSTAMGDGTTASGDYSTTMGFRTEAVGDASTAMGSYTDAKGNYSMSTGYKSLANGAASFAGGGLIEEAGSSTFKVGGGKAYGDGSFAFGAGTVAGDASGKGKGSVAMGTFAQAVSDNTFALGWATPFKDEDTAMSYMVSGLKDVVLSKDKHPDLYATWEGLLSTLPSGTIPGIASVDDLANITTEQAEILAAVCKQYVLHDPTMSNAELLSEAVGEYLPAISGTTASGENAIAMGASKKPQGVVASGANSIAFGTDARATHDNSVALGNNAITKAAQNVTGATIGTKTYNFTGGTTAEGVVSVGDTGHLKQIVNVANGAIESGSTDAVNGGQIFDIISNLPGGGGGEDANAVHYDGADKSTIALAGVNGTKISNLKAGEVSPMSTDAVNGAQLYARDLAISANTQEIREVGAISAALAGLHFAEPSGEEGDKLVGAVAYGGYRGANAEAIGLAYKPNPNMMLSASTSISNGNDSQNAYNVGFSLKFGKGETAKTKAELQKQVKYVSDENKELKSEIENLKKENAEIKEMLKKLIK
ncbi:MAG: YadA-like family protein [Synergistaceae bacterium]|nr:YadA-like family protein [Candidatus Equadaptatus faecalis]